MMAVHFPHAQRRQPTASDELITLRAGVPAEIYHLKAAGQTNWHKMD